MDETCLDCDAPTVAEHRCADCLEEVRESPHLICRECSRVLVQPSAGRRRSYCSRRCSDRSFRRRTSPPPGACARCGTPLVRRGKKYCSQKCGEIARGQRLAEPYPTRHCALDGCDVTFTPKYRTQRCCSERHGKLHYNRQSRADGRQKAQPWNDKRRDRYHRRRAQRKSATIGRPVILGEIATRDGWRCHLCRKKVNRLLEWPAPKSPSLDHLVPLSEGGTHDPTNVRLAHLVCNTRKGRRAVGEQLLLVG